MENGQGRSQHRIGKPAFFQQSSQRDMPIIISRGLAKKGL